MSASPTLEHGGAPAGDPPPRDRCGLSEVVAADVAARLAAAPDVRPDVVARARFGLAASRRPSMEDLASAMVADLTGSARSRSRSGR